MGDVVNRAALADLQESVGDRSVAIDIVRTYIDDVRGAVLTLREHTDAGRADGVRRTAHTVKPGSRLMGAGTLADLFARIEAIGAAGTVEGAAELVATAEAQVELVTAALESWIKE
jgi:chemotaxis protein histidine kinase CheA